MLPNQTNTLRDKLMQELVNLSNEEDHNQLKHQLSNIDHKLSRLYCGKHYPFEELYRQLYDIKPVPQQLSIPKQNSLTDSLLRSTLGCEQKLAKSYMQIVNSTEIKTQKERQENINKIKHQFQSVNTYRDFYANSRPFIPPTKLKTNRPVIDNQHSAYLQTHLNFIGKLIEKNVKPQTQSERNAEVVSNKIKQLGGIEDTIGRMQKSLKMNEISNNDKLKYSRVSNPFSAKKQTQFVVHEPISGNWIQRSRAIREQLLAKLKVKP